MSLIAIDSPVSIGYFDNPIHMIAIWDCWKQITNVYYAIPERKSTSVNPLSWKKILKENKIFSIFSFMKVTIQRLPKSEILRKPKDYRQTVG